MIKIEITKGKFKRRIVDKNPYHSHYNNVPCLVTSNKTVALNE